jgi:hypothetical protein
LIILNFESCRNLRKAMKRTIAAVIILLQNLTVGLPAWASSHFPSQHLNMQINENVTNPQKKLSHFLNEPANFISGSISGHVMPAASGTEMQKKGTVQSSLLASGDWYKIGVTDNAVFRMDYNFLKGLGLDPSGITKKYIRVYGKPGGMLPEVAGATRDKDLVENAIFVSGNGDDKFGTSDYILFYGQSPVQWLYNKSDKHFHHQPNAYSDVSYYFLNVSSDPGKRISNEASAGTSDRDITTFDDYRVHDNDQWTDITRNVKSGRQWWGEAFDKVSSQDFSFSFASRDVSQPVYLKGMFAARSLNSTSFKIKCNGNSVYKYALPAANFQFTEDYATIIDNTDPNTSFTEGSGNLNVNVTFDNAGDANAQGWMDFIELNVRSRLDLNNGQLSFRDSKTLDTGHVNRFIVSGASASTLVWDVSDFHNVSSVTGTYNNGSFDFTLASGSLKEFIAFDSHFPAPASYGKVANQDLHGLAQPDMIIITYPGFMDAANRIADFHRKVDKFTVHVVTTDQVYNEFSSGSQDVSALRDFNKMFYDRYQADNSLKKPGYVLLLGATSYDPKNRVPNNTNYIVTYESNDYGNSISSVNSYCSDDYIGFLDNDEGRFSVGDKVDIGVGRLPVQNADQANAMAAKIERYEDAKSMHDWRNVATFVADDQENDLFQESTETRSGQVKRDYPAFNINKIYLDAYKEQNTSSGLRYPDAQDAITKRVNAGTLVITYTGHGGGDGWAHERVLEVNDINSWTNGYAMPLFLTATCEFGRADDPVKVSAGELCLLNAKGGAIGLLTTTRLAESSGNDALTAGVFQNNIFRKDNGKGRRLGEIIRVAKRYADSLGFIANTRNFTLLGDPALRLAVPEDSVMTSSVNGVPVGNGKTDTLRAMTKVTISGFIAGYDGLLDSTFNGTVYPTIFDKPETITTLANVQGPSGSYRMKFNVQNSIIYKGEATVVNGRFTFSFIMPRDVSFTNSQGKISYYATNHKDLDAAGVYQGIIIGGSSHHPVAEDGVGPRIQLYINDTNFISGGLCNDTPHLLARLWDDVGINTVGDGIGHDITGILNDGDPIVMNDFYRADLNNYQGGWLNYPFNSLPDGNYRLTLKAWDVANNSSQAYIDFVVVSSNDFTIRNLFTFPNPMVDHTTFSFDHNADPDAELKVEINIYNMRGQIVKTLNEVPTAGGSHSKTVYWNGATDGGAPMAAGMYIYRISVSTPDNKHAELNSKLIIVR